MGLRWLALLASLVFIGCFVEERLAVAFDGLLVLSADLGGICDPILFVIALNKLLRCLVEASVLICWKSGAGKARNGSHLFGKPLQVIPGNFVFVLVDHTLDMGEKLLSVRQSIHLHQPSIP